MFLKVLFLLILNLSIVLSSELNIKGFNSKMSFEQACKMFKLIKLEDIKRPFIQRDTWCGYISSPANFVGDNEGGYIAKNKKNGTVKTIFWGKNTIDALFGNTDNLTIIDFTTVFIKNYKLDGKLFEMKRSRDGDVVISGKNNDEGWHIIISHLTYWTTLNLYIEFFEPPKLNFN